MTQSPIELEKLVVWGRTQLVFAHELWGAYGNNLVQTMIESYENGFNLAKTSRKALSGVQQGCKEVHDMLLGRDDLAGRYLTLLREKLGNDLHQVLGLFTARLRSISKRGKIRGSDEFYLVRGRIDEIEGDEQHEAELQELYRLIGEYENAPAKKTGKKKSAKKSTSDD